MKPTMKQVQEIREHGVRAEVDGQGELVIHGPLAARACRVFIGDVDVTEYVDQLTVIRLRSERPVKLGGPPPENEHPLQKAERETQQKKLLELLAKAETEPSVWLTFSDPVEFAELPREIITDIGPRSGTEVPADATSYRRGAGAVRAGDEQPKPGTLRLLTEPECLAVDDRVWDRASSSWHTFVSVKRQGTGSLTIEELPAGLVVARAVRLCGSYKRFLDGGEVISALAVQRLCVDHPNGRDPVLVPCEIPACDVSASALAGLGACPTAIGAVRASGSLYDEMWTMPWDAHAEHRKILAACGIEPEGT